MKKVILRGVSFLRRIAVKPAVKGDTFVFQSYSVGDIRADHGLMEIIHGQSGAFLLRC